MEYQMEASQLDTPEMFTSFLDTCNAALAEHEDDFPFQQIVQGGAVLLNNKRIGVSVYKDENHEPYDFYTIALDDGRFRLLNRGKNEPDLEWKLNDELLRHVAENPREYAAHPSRLDWRWITSRLGIDRRR